VIAPPGLSLPDASLTVDIAGQPGQSLGPFSFGQWGIAGRYQATPLWAWDTQSLPAGPPSPSPSNRKPDQAKPSPCRHGRRQTRPGPVSHARNHLLHHPLCRNTAAEATARLAVLVNRQAMLSVAQMHTDFSEKIIITLLPLLGHGGIASNETFPTWTATTPPTPGTWSSTTR
jgi:hypothetical protein